MMEKASRGDWVTIKDLQACRDIRSQIDSLDERIARLHSQAERLNRPLTSLTGGDVSDHLAEYVAKLTNWSGSAQARS